MTRPEIEAVVLRALATVAPEVEAASLRRDVPLREQVDLDSFDFLTFVVALHDATGVTVPEADYGKLATLADVVEYLVERVPT